MNLEEFSKKSGFKVLAVAGLNQIEYSLVLLLINYEATGLSDFITNTAEIETTIGYDAKEVEESLFNLSRIGIVKIKSKKSSSSFRLSLESDILKWQLDTKKQVEDAVIFPFMRRGVAQLKLFKQHKTSSQKAESTWQRVLDAFMQDKSSQILDRHDPLVQDAKLLVETHPVDQVLLILRHFKDKIPSLSLLASNWKHYQELFESETQKVDMLKARSSHYELDTRLKQDAKKTLEENIDTFSEDERLVLEILIRHQYPRRQLFWAYQSKSRYPNLKHFLEEHKKMMLAVTTVGRGVPHQTDS